MPKPISKSRFLDYLTCHKDAWFRLHQPDLEEFKVSATEQYFMDQGNVVEEQAKQAADFKALKQGILREVFG